MPASPKPLWLEWTVILLIRLMIVVTRLMPLVRARPLGKAVGAGLYFFNGRMRRVVASQSAQSTRQLMSEMGRVWRQPWAQTAALLEVDGLGCVKQPLASGQGVIVLGPHLGNWELLGMRLATLGNLVALYEPIPLKRLDQLAHRGRQCTGKLVPTTPRDIAELVRSGGAGGITRILPDQVPNDENAGVNALFFGVEWFTAALASILIKKSGAAPVMGTVLRTRKGFCAVYRPAEPGVNSDDTLQTQSAINLGVEKLVAGNERQYQWQYKRFRCRPKGYEDHYDWSAMPLLDAAGLKR